MSPEIIFFSCSYRDSVGFVFCGIFSVSFLEGSDLENGSYMGNYRLLEATCFLSPWEYCKHRYRNTVLTSLKWSLQFSILVKKIPDATLVVFWWFPCAVFIPAGSLITRRHLFQSCIITRFVCYQIYHQCVQIDVGAQQFSFNLSFQEQLCTAVYCRNIS